MYTRAYNNNFGVDSTESTLVSEHRLSNKAGGVALPWHTANTLRTERLTVHGEGKRQP